MADCTRQHTRGIGVYNATQRSIIVSYVQGKCAWRDTPPGFKLPAGYVTDTGVLISGENLNPGQSAVIADLCRDRDILIAATTGEIAVKIRQPDGSNKDFKDVAPNKNFPTFYGELTWRISEKPDAANLTSEPEYEITVDGVGEDLASENEDQS